MGPEMPYHSVFRELDDKNSNEEMAFLNEIDRQQMLERDNDYKNQLRQLWTAYGRQNVRHSPSAVDAASMLNGRRPVMEKRQLVLPWLPATRRKRFRVVKRSPVNSAKKIVNVSGTNETVTKELRSLFGPPSAMDERRKRSNGQTSAPGEILNGASIHHQTVNENQPHTNNDDHKHDDCKTEHDHAEDHEVKSDNKQQPANEMENGDSSAENSEEMSDSKLSANENITGKQRSYRNDLIPYRKKKAIQWSKYLGLDRRKKSDGWANKKYI